MVHQRKNQSKRTLLPLQPLLHQAFLQASLIQGSPRNFILTEKSRIMSSQIVMMTRRLQNLKPHPLLRMWRQQLHLQISLKVWQLLHSYMKTLYQMCASKTLYQTFFCFRFFWQRIWRYSSSTYQKVCPYFASISIHRINRPSPKYLDIQIFFHGTYRGFNLLTFHLMNISHIWTRASPGEFGYVRSWCTYRNIESLEFPQNPLPPSE